MRMTLNKPREKDESARTRLLAAAMAIRANCRHGKKCKDCLFHDEDGECALACTPPKDWTFEEEENV